MKKQIILSLLLIAIITIYILFLLQDLFKSTKKQSVSSQTDTHLTKNLQIMLFSPLEQIYVRQLGMNDKNQNGVIDKNAGEGYDEFINRYGNADIGFFINGIIQGENNGRLEINEIVNHYYINIRFDNIFSSETTAIENEVSEYIHANNLPLLWMDDRQGTVMNAINGILGIGWQNEQITLDEAERKFIMVMDTLNIKGLTGTPFDPGLGYKQLNDFIIKREGFCFEAAQFGFWFFSQLKLSSSVAIAALNPTLVHAVIKLNKSNTIIDYFKTGNSYNVPVNQWAISNPVQSIGDYYYIHAVNRKNTENAEKSVIYDKYNISRVCSLMDLYADIPNRNHQEIIALGEFIFDNIDIHKMMTSGDNNIINLKRNFAYLLSILVEDYNAVGNRQGFNNVETLLNQYYSNDPKVKPLLDYYRF